MDLIEKAISKFKPNAVEGVEHDGNTSKADVQFAHVSGAVASPNVAQSGGLGARTHNFAPTRTTPLRPNDIEPDVEKRRIALDLQRFQNAGMLVPDGSRSRIKEEYRHIKQPVLLNASGEGAVQNPFSNLVMVTSSVPGEGKTFTAINLAMSIASERDRTVLLIDADVLRANLSGFFNIHKDLGLVDYLVNDSLSLSDVMIGTDISSLKILPAGNTHHLSTELLSSGQMRTLVQELSQRYPERIVIFDSPPLLHTSEARVLAQLMGQIIVVVEAERTPRGQVHDALDLLQDVNTSTSVSMVLNKTRKGREWSYYYSYGYSYY